jgi:hypothetical protein
MDPTDITLPNISGGYLLELDAYAYDDPNVLPNSVFRSSKNIPVTIKYPKDDEIVIEQKNYIKSWFDNFESKLYSSNYTDPVNGYRKYLDIKSFADYFVYEEFIGNPDAYWSTYMIKKRNDDLFYVGPAWDFDLSMDNDTRVAPVNAINNFLSLTKGSSAGTPCQVAGYFNLNDPNVYKNNTKEMLLRLMTDPNFVEELRNSWADIRENKGLTRGYLFNKIMSLKNEVKESEQLNIVRWSDGAIPKGSYDAEVDFVLNYCYDRIDWMDGMLNLNSDNSDDNFIYQPLELNGFNSDIVVENRPIDSHISRAISADLFVCYTASIREENALPDDGVLVSSKSNAIYQLAPYNGKQATFIRNGETAQLNLAEPQSTKGLSILASCANGNSTMKVVINYTDGTSQIGRLKVDDWWSSLQKPAVSNLGQVQAYNAGNGVHTTFRLYEYRIMTDETKIISSISFSNTTDSRPFIFAISKIVDSNSLLQSRTAKNEEAISTVEKEVENVSVNIWPNPVLQGQTVYIKSENIAEVRMLSLQKGNLIKTIKPSDNIINIPMDVEKGIYIIQIISNNNSTPISKKIIVK